MVWVKRIAVAFALIAVGVIACVTFRDPIEDRVPVNILRALRDPESFEILALDPVLIDERAKDARSVPAEREFHGYEILGHAPLNEPGARKELVGFVLRGIQESDGKVAACFDPRHGIRVVKEGRVIDLVICYECLQMTIHGGDVDRKEPLGVLTSSSVEPAVTRIYTAAGLKIHGK
jgi:hypothetical protein